jgi:hypothetical protein
MSTIVRLRGDAEELVWPGAALRPHLDQRAWLRDVSPGHDTSWANRRRWSDASLAAHAANVQAFAEAQGWRVSKGFALDRLVRRRASLLWPNWARDVVDHPDFFWRYQRSPALVVHLYGELVLDRVPDALVVDRLPESWYWPGMTTAYVFRPGSRQAIQSVSVSAEMASRTEKFTFEEREDA